jgi:hypothetical protein
VRLDEKFTVWLERMLDPIPEDRFRDARQALQNLTGDAQLASVPRPRQPIARVREDGDCLRISIPAIWWGSRISKITCLATLLPLIPISLIIWFGTFSKFSVVLLLTWFLFIPYLNWLAQYLFAIATRYEMEIDSQNFTIDSFCGAGKSSQTVSVGTIQSIAIEQHYISIVKVKDLSIIRSSDSSHHKIASFGGFLDNDEKSWLASELNDRLQARSAD